MAHLATIPTKAAVDRAFQRYAELQRVIQSDPHARQDPAMQAGLMRAHERFCKLFNEWAGR
jgi:hypothetical protein